MDFLKKTVNDIRKYLNPNLNTTKLEDAFIIAYILRKMPEQLSKYSKSPELVG